MGFNPDQPRDEMGRFAPGDGVMITGGQFKGKTGVVEYQDMTDKSYTVNVSKDGGQQYVSVISGHTLVTFALRD